MLVHSKLELRDALTKASFCDGRMLKAQAAAPAFSQQESSTCARQVPFSEVRTAIQSFHSILSQHPRACFLQASSELQSERMLLPPTFKIYSNLLNTGEED